MKTRLRTVALSATAVVALSGCAMLPFEVVPRESEDAPTAQEEPSEEEATEEPEAEETTFSHSGQQGDEGTPDSGTSSSTGPDGKTNYDTTPDGALPLVVELCDLPEDTLGDEDRTLVLDTPGTREDTGSLTVDDLGCALGYLGPSDAVMAQIENTPTDGSRQTATDGYLTYSWTLSDERGLDFIVTVSDEEN